MLLYIYLKFLNNTDLLVHLDPVLVIYLQFQAPTLQLMATEYSLLLQLNSGTPFQIIFVVLTRWLVLNLVWRLFCLDKPKHHRGRAPQQEVWIFGMTDCTTSPADHAYCSAQKCRNTVANFSTQCSTENTGLQMTQSARSPWQCILLD